MFKQWRRNHQNRNDILEYSAYLLGVLSDVVLKFQLSQKAINDSGITEKDAVDIMNKIKGIDEKQLVSVLVDAIKSKEKSGE